MSVYSPLFDVSYPPPRGNVLLLTCMDMRLLGEIVRFMHHDNLSNRYDHLIFPGSALGALGGNQDQFPHWRKTFRDQFQIACDLHHIQTVYLVEHRDCGAYAKLLGSEGVFGETKAESLREAKVHRRYSQRLESLIHEWAQDLGRPLSVYRFLMGLRGEVERLDSRQSKSSGRSAGAR